MSKFLSLLLRHQPKKTGLQPDAQGWASVEELLKKLKASNHPPDRPTLEHIVATNNKKRFAFSKDGSKIRDSQGHSRLLAGVICQESRRRYRITVQPLPTRKQFYEKD